ncbi:uncharacterized protein LOC106472839 [Limulus polyphemus]|uniref:Uncharacterized protein LOC106472839 n=1 Tax=Limulus polyphemus TaxID=6850 RepID=A0ABM1BUK3_LIMPO|nr:uncharacterized protein LOC106472839 [Limulus polyphemus]
MKIFVLFSLLFLPLCCPSKHRILYRKNLVARGVHGRREMVLRTVKSDQAFSDYMKKIIGNFRVLMRTGSDELHLPVLDPLKLPNKNINKNNHGTRIRAQLKNLKISGLSQIQISTLQADVRNLKLELGLLIPNLSVTGTYFLDGIVARLFPLNGNGKFQVTATNAKIYGAAVLILTSGGTIQLDNVDLDIDFRAIGVRFDNLLGGGPFGAFLNKLMTSFGHKIFNVFKGHLIEKLETSFKKSVNRDLAKVKFANIIQGKL